MWKEDSQGRALWPRRFPLIAIKPSSMRILEDIKWGLQGFINHWDQLSKEDLSEEYRRRYKPLSYYWQQVKTILDLPFEYEGTLKDGFWPSTRIAPLFEDEFTETRNAREEYDEDKPFVGQACDRPTESFSVNRDLYEEYFVAIRPSNDDIEHPEWI